jgi:hypothetical protein
MASWLVLEEPDDSIVIGVAENFAEISQMAHV